MRIKPEWIEAAISAGACMEGIDEARAARHVEDLPVHTLIWVEDRLPLVARAISEAAGVPLWVMGYGDGYGAGYGYGYGYGYGNGYGYGDGYGYGYGDGYGDGDGEGKYTINEESKTWHT